MDSVDFNTVVGSVLPQYGNRCGHDPERPRFFVPPEKHANRPKVLQRITQAIRDYYARPFETLPGLNACNESERQQRSERREACCAILGAIFHYTDLITLRVGIPQPDGSMKGLTVAYLANIAGMDERRAERAIANLKAAGLITVHKVCEKLDDLTYKGLAAIRTISRRLFDVFGLGQWLQHERRKAKERWEKRIDKRRRKDQANVAMAMNAKLNADLKELKRQQDASSEPPKKGGLSPVAELCFKSMRQALSKKPIDSS
jgi:hypothetical protein